MVFSFTNIRYISTIQRARFIGLKNYIELFHDVEFINAFKNSIVYSLFFVPIVMVVSLLIAVLVNKKIYFRKTVRAMIFMPYISNLVAIAIVWSVLLNPIDGIVNQALRSIGLLDTPMWLMSSKSALFTVVIIAV